MILGLAILAGGGALAVRERERWRRRELNACLHELRRPLQALALAEPSEARAPDGGWLSQLADAVARLDETINGSCNSPVGAPFGGRELAEQAARRWRFAGVELGSCVDAPLAGRSTRLGAALDNLIANALEHGDGRVRLEMRRLEGRLLVAVCERAAAASSSRADPRRGHGLRIAARAADEHGGRLIAPRQLPGGAVAALELPVASGDGPQGE